MASMDVFRLSLLSVEPRTTRLTFVAEQASSAGMKLLRLRRRGGRVEKGRRIKLFLRHPSLSSLVLISCKIEIYGGGKNLGEGIVEALRGCGKLKMYVVLSLFFFLSRDLSFYRGRLSREWTRIKETRTDGKFLYACMSCKIFENRILDGLFVDGLDDDDYL